MSMKSKKIKNSPRKLYDLVIVGAGISGAALLYVLGKYSNIKSVAVIEKFPEPARVNSDSKNNSQTLHFGDIETNYTLEKARLVKEAAEMTRRYLERSGQKSGLYKKLTKMVLAVGPEEVAELKQRHKEFGNLYPNLKLLQKSAIAEVEPKVVEGRSPEQEIAALFTEDGYTVNYGKLAKAFLKEATLGNDTTVDFFMPEKTKKIERVRLGGQKDPAYRVITNRRQILSKTVAVTAGGYSLIFAQALGYGREYTFLSVAGGFYFAPRLLNGKVYRVQIKGLPFAAIHGDPDINDLNLMRFGPTAKIIPLIERRNYGTLFDYLTKIIDFNLPAIYAILRVMLDPMIFFYGFKNFFYDWPVVGRRLFMKYARDIVPTLRLKDLVLAKGIGGSRPQIVNIKKGKMEMGEAKIIGKNIIFNITPSPGATRALSNGYEDARKIIEFLGEDYRFRDGDFKRDFMD